MLVMHFLHPLHFSGSMTMGVSATVYATPFSRKTFRMASIAADGSSVIGKHDGTAGGVTVGTVTSQLVYEIGGPVYANPDVMSRFDTTVVTQEGPDRVRLSGTVGLPAPPTAKVAINYHGGYRNSMAVGLCGLDIEAKAELVTNQLWATVPGGRDAFDDTETRLVRTDSPDATGNEAATAWLRVTVWDDEEKQAGRSFSGAATQLALSSIPVLRAIGSTVTIGVVGNFVLGLLIARHDVAVERDV